MPPLLSLLRSRSDALIFDVDGTLLDSMSVWNQADVVFLNRRGFEVTPDYTDHVKSGRIEDAAEYTKRRFNLPESIQDIMDEWNGFVNSAYAHKVPLKDGALTYLQQARFLGFKTACATALTRVNVDAAFNRLKIHDLFDVIVTLDDLPAAPDKSEPDVYLHVAKLLDADPSRTLVYEDILTAIKGARKGNFLTCAVYDEIGAGSSRGWEKMRGISDYFIRDWTDAF